MTNSLSIERIAIMEFRSISSIQVDYRCFAIGIIDLKHSIYDSVFRGRIEHELVRTEGVLKSGLILIGFPRVVYTLSFTIDL